MRPCGPPECAFHLRPSRIDAAILGPTIYDYTPPRGTCQKPTLRKNEAVMHRGGRTPKHRTRFFVIPRYSEGSLRHAVVQPCPALGAVSRNGSTGMMVENEGSLAPLGITGWEACVRPLHGPFRDLRTDGAHHSVIPRYSEGSLNHVVAEPWRVYSFAAAIISLAHAVMSDTLSSERTGWQTSIAPNT